MEAFFACHGFEADLPVQLNWPVAEMTTYDIILGIIEFAGGFARWETGACPRSSLPTLWSKTIPPNSSPTEMEVEGQGVTPAGVAAAATDASMDRGVTQASAHGPAGMTHRPATTSSLFPVAREHQLPPSLPLPHGVLATSANDVHLRISRVEGDISGLRHDVEGLKGNMERLEQGSQLTGLSLTLLLEKAGFTPEVIAERMARERASQCAARGGIPLPVSASASAPASSCAPLHAQSQGMAVDDIVMQGTPAPESVSTKAEEPATPGKTGKSKPVDVGALMAKSADKLRRQEFSAILGMECKQPKLVTLHQNSTKVAILALISHFLRDGVWLFLPGEAPRDLVPARVSRITGEGGLLWHPRLIAAADPPSGKGDVADGAEGLDGYEVEWAAIFLTEAAARSSSMHKGDPNLSQDPL